MGFPLVAPRVSIRSAIAFRTDFADCLAGRLDEHASVLQSILQNPITGSLAGLALKGGMEKSVCRALLKSLSSDKLKAPLAAEVERIRKAVER